MPGRKIPFVNGNYYHVFNRGVARLPTFTDQSEYQRAVKTIDYYRFATTKIRYSTLVSLPQVNAIKALSSLKRRNEKLVEILSFVLMPNHYHFILKQVLDDGVSKFISDFANSYTRYVNVKKNRPGPLFQGKFKAVGVKSDEQLLHLSRYIHLNPLTDRVVKDFAELMKYSYSSLPHYLGRAATDFVTTDEVLSHFENEESYGRFIKKQKDYQRSLKLIRRLLLENRGKS